MTSRVWVWVLANTVFLKRYPHVPHPLTHRPQLLYFSEVGPCGRLFVKMDAPWSLHPEQCDFAAPSIEKWSLIPYHFNQALWYALTKIMWQKRQSARFTSRGLGMLLLLLSYVPATAKWEKKTHTHSSQLEHERLWRQAWALQPRASW